MFPQIFISFREIYTCIFYI